MARRRTRKEMALAAYVARTCFGLFAKAVRPSMSFEPFHIAYYRTLQAFADGRVRRLIVTMPPQHGKSLGATTLLPAYMLGLNPDLRIAIASYSDTFAKRFNRDIQRVIDCEMYRALFPGTALNGTAKAEERTAYLRNASEFEIVGKAGGLKAVGRGGGLTGNTVDVVILDDLYKDAMEGNSPTIREAAWEWYTSVVRTRLHNNSQELIVFTRWHEDDIIGRLLKVETHREITAYADLEDLPADTWAVLNFEAIKEGERTEVDDRDKGVALWEARHSLATLTAKRQLDAHTFECMYQGHPASREGLLYSGFDTYDTLPAENAVLMRGAYVDTADTGDDYLCAIAYVLAYNAERTARLVYVTDVVYTAEAMEVTEGAVASMLTRNGARRAMVESNNGGRGFARAVQQRAPLTRVEWFTQHGNKEARILSNSATVQAVVRFPADWAIRFPLFFAHLTEYKRIFRANAHDDAPDALTGVIETEFTNKRRTTRYAISR